MRLCGDSTCLLRCHRGTMGRMAMKSMRRILGHSLLRSLVHSNRLLTHSLASLAHSAALIRSLSRSLTHLLWVSWEKYSMNCLHRFQAAPSSSKLQMPISYLFQGRLDSIRGLKPRHRKRIDNGCQQTRRRGRRDGAASIRSGAVGGGNGDAAGRGFRWQKVEYGWRRCRRQ